MEDSVQGNTASEAGVTHKGQSTDPNTEQRGIGQKLKDAVTSKNSAGNSANVNNPHHVSTYHLPSEFLVSKCFLSGLCPCSCVPPSGASSQLNCRQLIRPLLCLQGEGKNQY